MNRIDDMRMYELLNCLLTKEHYIPTYDDIEYAKGLILEAGRMKPEDADLKKNASKYGDIVGKAYLFLILYDKMYGDP